MRKVTLEIEPYPEVWEADQGAFRQIVSYEVLEVLRLDHIKGLFIDLIECRLREGVSIGDVHVIGDMEVLSVVSSEGDKHICLVKGRESEASREEFSKEEMDLIYTTPSMVSEDRIVVSFICSQRDLERFVGRVRERVGRVVNMSFSPASYTRKETLSSLTDRQREVIVAAYAHGYFEIPRRIGSDQLADKLGMSRSTLLEHMRKSEARLMRHIMAGRR